MTLYRKYTRALKFENLCQASFSFVIVLPIASLWVVQAVAAHAVSAALYTVAAMSVAVLALGIALYFYWDLTLFLLGLFWEFFKAYPAAAALLLAILFVWGCCARQTCSSSQRKRRADAAREGDCKAAQKRRMDLEAEIARLIQALNGKSAEVDALQAQTAALQSKLRKWGIVSRIGRRSCCSSHQRCRRCKTSWIVCGQQYC